MTHPINLAVVERKGGRGSLAADGAWRDFLHPPRVSEVIEMNAVRRVGRINPAIFAQDRRKVDRCATGRSAASTTLVSGDRGDVFVHVIMRCGWCQRDDDFPAGKLFQDGVGVCLRRCDMDAHHRVIGAKLDHHTRSDWQLRQAIENAGRSVADYPEIVEVFLQKAVPRTKLGQRITDQRQLCDRYCRLDGKGELVIIVRVGGRADETLQHTRRLCGEVESLRCGEDANRKSEEKQPENNYGTSNHTHPSPLEQHYFHSIIGPDGDRQRLGNGDFNTQALNDMEGDSLT